MSLEANEEKLIEKKAEVSTYLDRLKYALSNGQAKIQFQHHRLVDNQRELKFTNRFTIVDLFPDEDEILALKRELNLLNVSDYIETVKDRRFIKRSEMRVFGKYYNSNDVYIKIRVELMKPSSFGVDDHVFVMSFHYAETKFRQEDFPYCKK